MLEIAIYKIRLKHLVKCIMMVDDTLVFEILGRDAFKAPPPLTVALRV